MGTYTRPFVAGMLMVVASVPFLPADATSLSQLGTLLLTVGGVLVVWSLYAGLAAIDDLVDAADIDD